MIVSPQNKVGKIVSDDYRTARVFSQFGIDFCCKGGISLEEACKLNQVKLEDVTQALQSISPLPDAYESYKSMKLTELIDHIVDKHHRYINETGPTLLAYLHKISQVHGERHPELIPVYELFHGSLSELTLHMKKEELNLFPLIRKAEKNGTDNRQLEAMMGPVSQMEVEHSLEGDRFREISRLTQQYTPPADGCQTYRVAFHMLAEFEADLHQHIHLENNILFPAALGLQSLH
jgi:regulator of cell morphogenesis and NO signaling